MPSERPVRRRRPLGVLGVVVLALALMPLGWILNALVPAPTHLGARQGRLAECPDSPNCISSQSADPAQRAEPLRFDGPADQAQARFQEFLGGRRGARMVREEPGYLHYTFRSLLLGFVDDVEFLFEPATGTIQVRSASRLGYSDLGANRRRVEALRIAWNGSRLDAGGR